MDQEKRTVGIIGRTVPEKGYAWVVVAETETEPSYYVFLHQRKLRRPQKMRTGARVDMLVVQTEKGMAAFDAVVMDDNTVVNYPVVKAGV